MGVFIIWSRHDRLSSIANWVRNISPAINTGSVHIYVLRTYLDQEPQVDILALWLLPVHLTVLVMSDVDSLLES